MSEFVTMDGSFDLDPPMQSNKKKKSKYSDVRITAPPPAKRTNKKARSNVKLQGGDTPFLTTGFIVQPPNSGSGSLDVRNNNGNGANGANLLGGNYNNPPPPPSSNLGSNASNSPDMMMDTLGFTDVTAIGTFSGDVSKSKSQSPNQRNSSSFFDTLADNRVSESKMFKQMEGQQHPQSTESIPKGAMMQQQEEDEEESSSEEETNIESKIEDLEKKIEKYEDKIAEAEAQIREYQKQLDPKKVWEKKKVRKMVRRISQDEIRENLQSDKANASSRKASNREDVDALQFMKDGSSMLKYGRYGFPHFRQFELSQDGHHLLWFSSGKKLGQSRIDLRNVTKLQKGQLTPIFKKHLQPRLASCSFSIFYRELSGKEKTLDVITKNRSAFQIWTKGLERLIDYHQAIHRKVRGMGGREDQDVKKPDKIMVNVAKRNVANIEKRLSMQPEPPRKVVIKKFTDCRTLLMEVRKDSFHPAFDLVRDIRAVRERIQELEEELGKVERGFREKKLGVTQHEIWRVNVEVRTIRNKVNALAKTHEIQLHGAMKSAYKKIKALGQAI